MIANNYIEKPGAEFEDGIGICVGYSRNLLLDHNEVNDTPYTGISVGWGWSAAGYSFKNTISHNAVGFCMKVLHDGAGIYTLGQQGDAQNKTRWFGNYVHHIDNKGQGLYPDEGSAFMEIRDNVVGKVGANWVNIWTNRIHDIEVFNNFSDTTKVKNSGTNCIVRDNNETISLDKLPEAASAIVKKAGLEPEFTDIKKHARGVIIK